jgi:Mn2+/Fe2+ NRAMP family transporter
MTESTEQQSTWRTKLKALGPGILMASAAVGGSHIVSSTQAGAIYGWQLALLIILINIFNSKHVKAEVCLQASKFE